jgi:hypothetical protein
MKQFIFIIIQLIVILFIISCNNRSKENYNFDVIEIVDYDNNLPTYDYDNLIHEEIEISDIDVFDNIFETPYPYRELEGFHVDEINPLTEDGKGHFVVENENIEILYVVWNFDYQIWFYEIKKRNNIYPLGKYIGIESEIILKIFGESKRTNDSVKSISYKNEDQDTIVFLIENNIITRIIIFRDLGITFDSEFRPID